MVLILQLSILSLAVLVVCGVPQRVVRSPAPWNTPPPIKHWNTPPPTKHWDTSPPIKHWDTPATRKPWNTPTPPPTTGKKCIDISSRCAHNAFQCNTSSYVRENCNKTCNLCDIKPACDPLCPAIFDPVCGTDGVTYENNCSLGVAACLNPEADIRVQHKGECSACDPLCPAIFDPVCGTDGVTYENDCSLGVAACLNPEADIRVQHRGECSDLLVCPVDPRPHGDCYPLPGASTCNNDGDCANRFGADIVHKCCRDACLGKTCKIAIPAIPKW